MKARLNKHWAVSIFFLNGNPTMDNKGGSLIKEDGLPGPSSPQKRPPPPACGLGTSLAPVSEAKAREPRDAKPLNGMPAGPEGLGVKPGLGTMWPGDDQKRLLGLVEYGRVCFLRVFLTSFGRF